MSGPAWETPLYRQTAQDFVRAYMQQIGPLLSWVVCGSALSLSSPSDLDLVLICETRPSEAEWHHFCRAWYKLQAVPRIDPALMTPTDLASTNLPLTSSVAWTQYILRTSTKWQGPELPIRQLPPERLYWMLAERWWQKSRRDATAVPELAAVLCGHFPLQHSLTKREIARQMPQVPLDVLTHIRHHLERGEGLTPQEREEWLGRLGSRGP